MDPLARPGGFSDGARVCAREPGGHQMSKAIRRPLLTAVVSLLAATVACNQSSTAPHERFTLQGQVTGAGGAAETALKAELAAPTCPHKPTPPAGSLSAGRRRGQRHSTFP